MCCGDDGGGVLSLVEAGRGGLIIISDAESDFWSFAA